MINEYQKQQSSFLLYDNFQKPPSTYSSTTPFHQFQQQLRYAPSSKPTYSNITQFTSAKTLKSDEHDYRDSPFKLKQREESIKRQIRNQTPIKKYANLNENPKSSFIMEPKYTPQKASEIKHMPLNNKQFHHESVHVPKNLHFYSRQATERPSNTLSQPRRLRQKSPITRHQLQKNHFQPKKKQPYFQYILQYSFRSKKGSSIIDPHKVNQDAVVTSPNLNNQSWLHYFGVCDGHGPSGHLVSSFVKKNLPLALAEIKNVDENLKLQMMDAFKTVADRLPIEVNADLGASGSTSVGVYLNHNKLYCCNLGDSKAALGSFDKIGKWRATALSIDHKPQNPHEATRIIRSKGRIESYRDQNGQPVGPLRVWLKNDDIPGLAMTRCFGDQIACQVGVISLPEIRQFVLCEKDRIIIIATDGIWQFLSVEQVINIVAPYYQQRNIEQACNALLSTAIKLWKQDNCEAIDDITFVLLFLDYSLDSAKYSTK